MYVVSVHCKLLAAGTGVHKSKSSINQSVLADVSTLGACARVMVLALFTHPFVMFMSYRDQ